MGTIIYKTSCCIAALLAVTCTLRGEEGDWIYFGTLSPAGAAAGDEFGTSVALSGNTAVIGAPGRADAGVDSGAAYLFNITTGVQTGTLVRDDPAPGDLFGKSVAISGSTAVIGAEKDADAGTDSGSAYLFNTTTLAQSRKLAPLDAAVDKHFGYSVAIDGQMVLVGAYGDSESGLADAGAAYTFNADTGVQLERLESGNPAASDWLGYSVGISGTSAILGALNADPNGSNSGEAYLYDTLADQRRRLLPDDGYAGDRFGVAVGISGDTAIVGAYGDDDDGTSSGSAYLFNVTGGSQRHKLTADNARSGDFFGRSVAIDQSLAVVGAPGDSYAGIKMGSIYLFDTATGNQVAHLAPPGGKRDDNFGWSVAASGETIVVGAPKSDPAGSGSGAAYLFGKETAFLRDGIPLVGIQVGHLGPGQVLTGHGISNNPFAAAASSTISVIEGDMTLGNPDSAAGFATEGEILVTGRTLTLQSASAASLGNQTQLIGGVLRSTSGTSLAPTGTLSGNGTIYGFFYNEGTISGNSPATGERIVFAADSTVTGDGSHENVSFLGTYDPGSSTASVQTTNGVFGSVLRIELGGDQPGPGAGTHDQVNDLGTLQILEGSELVLVPVDNFLPEPGDQWTILTWQTELLGTFDNVEIDPWFTDAGIDFHSDYNNPAGSGFLEMTATALLANQGDINADDTVDQADLNLLLSSISSPPTPQDQTDLATLLENFGRTDLARPAAVPEPTALAMFLVGIVGLLARRRQKQLS